jgi:hypothetical protein
LLIQNGAGSAAAFLGDPAVSGVTGMGSTAFGLAAGPQSSGAFVSADRVLARPLAVGETFSFDWGINWDSDTGLKGFEIFSGSTALFKVMQNGFPGSVSFYEWFGVGEVPTGLGFGTHPMRWTFRQLDAQAVRVSATSRQGGSGVAFTRDVPVPGAVSGLHWFSVGMEPDARRYSLFERLAIEPLAAGGGDLSGSTIFVRLAAGVMPGDFGGEMVLASGAEISASIAVSGSVGPANAYDSWAVSHGMDPGGDGARGADADGDGHSNLHEFLFGSSPVQATGSLWRHEMQPSGLVLTFIGRETGVSYKLVSTVDLVAGTWAEESLVMTEPTDQGGMTPGYKRRQVVVPNPVGNRFFRLQAAESSP